LFDRLRVLASRLVFARAVDQEVFKRACSSTGAGPPRRLANLRRSRTVAVFVAGFVRPPAKPAVPAGRLLDPAGDLRGLCERLNVSEVVVAMDDRRRGFPIRELSSAVSRGGRHGAPQLSRARDRRPRAHRRP